MTLHQVPPLVAQRLASHGKRGQEFADSLPERVLQLEAEWQISVGQVLEGGSASFVAEAECADGSPAVLKIGFPDVEDLKDQVKVFSLAAGRGYAELYASHAEMNAMLLEPLGGRLSQSGMDTDQQFRVICETLAQAWIKIDESHGLMTGAEKALWLKNFIETRWQLLDKPCSKATVNTALEFIEERVDCFNPVEAFLVHADAHSDNTLKVRKGECHKFVDPDGLFAEKACDLAPIMRDWSEELLSDPQVGLMDRCQRLADLTGVQQRAIWQWGFMERVSTGLVLQEIGMANEAKAMLAVADAACNMKLSSLESR